MPKGIRKLHISVGEYNLTYFGGIPLIHAFCKNLKLKWLLQAYVKFPQRSSRYHPLLCFESHIKDFWHGVLRPGDAYTAFGSVEFWKECFAKIPSYVYRIRLRADSGFFDHKLIYPLDEEGIGCVLL